MKMKIKSIVNDLDNYKAVSTFGSSIVFLDKSYQTKISSS